jgi:hypothetical protein
MTTQEATGYSGNGAALATRDGLGNETRIRQHETAATAGAARAQAAIQARFVMALQRPRSLDDVRTDLLTECRRPKFAEVSRYKLPRGGKAIEGWSIRFVEAAVRCMRNLAPETVTLFDDEDKRLLRCSIIDLESNVEWAQEITVEKTVERRELKEGQIPIGTRTNSYGQRVYLVRCTEDDFRMKEGAMVSRALRTLGLRVIPGDLLDDAEKQVEQTCRAEIKADPAAAKKRMLDNFAGIGVRAVDLITYLGGKPLDALDENDVFELRGVFAAVKDGERWKDILEASPHVTEKPGDDRLKGVREKVAAKVAAMKKPKPKAATATKLPGEAATTEKAAEPAAAPASAEREPGED